MDKLDKSKALVKQRLNKPKVPAPPGELIALGSKPKPEDPGPSSKVPVPSARRDSQPSTGSLLSKKTTVPFIPVTKTVDLEKTTTAQTQYDEGAIDCAPAEFYDAVMAAYDSNDDEKIERLLCGAVRYLKNNRAKPDNQIALSLIYFAKAYPGMFTTENVTAAFSSLLKRDPSASFKAKGNPIVMVLTCNIMYTAFAAEDQWPDIFLKVFLEDSMGERLWVDRADCRCFTENIITAYNTKLPPRSMMTLDAPAPAVTGTVAATSLISASTSPSNTPRAASGFPDDEPMELGSTASNLAAASSTGAMPLERSDSADEPEPVVLPRYVYQQDAAERQATEFVSEQFGKRQPVDTSSRQLLKTIATMCGVVDVRLAAVQRLEMWLQNPKLSRPAQDLLLFICFNCGQRDGGISDPKELEVVTQLLKLRLKTKQLLTHYLICLRELMSQNDHNLHTVVALTLYNELSNSRNSNNMAVLGTAVQVSSEKTSTILAEIFVDLLMNKEDYLRAVRTLLREIVRSVRNDIDFPAFCLALMAERKPEKFQELDASTKERLFASITDLVALSQLLCITPAVREAAANAPKGDRRDFQAMRCFWKQVSTIQRDSVWWMQEIVPSSFELNKQDYIYGLYKILMMQPADSYYKVDGWPPEPERHTILRIATETPVREDTIIRILIVGLTTGLPLSAAEALDVADLMVRRAAVAATNIAGHVGIQGTSLLEVSNLDLVQLLFNAAAYHHPENIKLPRGYEPPCLAIASSYWKVWQMLLIVSAFNPGTFGRITWESYETLRVMMEMVMTNNYRFPPPTISPDESVIQRYLQKERQAVEHEKQAILEFEGHLAAATSKSTITEQNSVLLSLLMSMEPAGDCRKPPDDVLESLKTMNKTMSLGPLLCRSRNPDFLLSIIERQGTVGSMPWLADLVEASEGSLDVLPVQCLCEFLLHDMPLPVVPTPPVVLSPDEVAAAALNVRRKSSSSSVLSSQPVVRDSDNGENAERISRSTSVQTSKHDKLLSRLRSMLFTPDTFGQAAINSATEILGYFLQRLQLPTSASRAAALKGLAAVLGTTQRHGRDSAMDVDDEHKGAGSASQKFSWLLEDLPCIPAYRHVKPLVIARLCEVLRLETSTEAVEAFLTYLSKECLGSEDQLLARTVEAMSCVLVERSGVLCSLLAQTSPDAAEGADLQNGLLTVYAEFVRRACNPQWLSGDSDADKSSGLTSRIVVQWVSGQSCVMGVAVLQATVILLTVCQPATGANHSDLCELWFPSGGRRPSVRWLERAGHGEEHIAEKSVAQLCPDFLRLLMLRSSLPPVVDAAVDGVGVDKLLVFVQSFGIPVVGTRRLLMALDEITIVQPEVVLAAARARRDYLLELIEIQHARGVKEGAQFCSLLLADSNSGSRPQVVRVNAADCDTSSKKPRIGGFQTGSRRPVVDLVYERSSRVIVPERLDGMVEFIRLGLLALDSHGSPATTRRLCRALQVKMAANELVRHTFLAACNEILTTSKLALTRAFWTISTDIAPVLRLVVSLIQSSSKTRPPGEAEAAAAACALFDALICSQPNGTSDDGRCELLRSVLAKAATWLRPAMDTRADVDGIDIADGNMERVINGTVTELVLAGKPVEAAKFCIQKIKESEQSSDGAAPPDAGQVAATGLLVDWLQAVSLEGVTGAASTYHAAAIDREALDLLFGQRCGHTLPCSAYLRAVLLHQASWDTVRAVVGQLLVAVSEPSGGALDASAVLDFLSSCVHHPKLYQGRVRKKPKKSQPDDVLGLSADAIERVAQLVVLEAIGKSKTAAVECVDGRMELLCSCCHEDADKLRALARHVEARVLSTDCLSPLVAAGVGDSGDGVGGRRLPDGDFDEQRQQQLQRVYKYLLVRLYAWAPRVIKWLRNDGAALDSDPAVLLHGPCALDAHTHKVLAALGAAVGVKKRNEVALNDANLLCRKVASDHPLLFLRQLPMMLALLSGRCDFTFGEFKHRNHLLLFTHVFGIAELLQPHVFMHPSFGDLVSSYLNFFREYGQKSLAPFFGKFVQLLHNFIHCAPSKMAQVLGSHVATLGYLCSVYPAMSQAKSLLSAVSLPQKEAAAGTPTRGSSSEDKRAALPMLNPPLTAEQLAPFRARLHKDASTDDVIAVLKDIDSTSMIKVDILVNFVDDLKRLLSAGKDECRNTAHSLMMRCLRNNPRCARDFVDSYAACLEHDSPDVQKSALLNLAEFIVLCDEDDATALLQRAFVAAMKLDGGESMTHVKEALQLLNLENVTIT